MASNQGQAPILTETEQKSVLKSFDGTPQELRNKAIFLLSFRAGLRAKEIATVKLSDFLNPKVLNRSAKTKCKSDDILKTVTLRKDVAKAGKISKAHITDAELRKALLDYINIRDSLFNRKVDTLFITIQGTSFSPNSLSRLFLEMSKACAYNFTSHSGRRSLCSILINKGIDVFKVKSIMRHENIATTELYYENDEVLLGEIMANLCLTSAPMEQINGIA
jgi:integrase/recombinase XerD